MDNDPNNEQDFSNLVALLTQSVVPPEVTCGSDFTAWVELTCVPALRRWAAAFSAQTFQTLGCKSGTRERLSSRQYIHGRLSQQSRSKSQLTRLSVASPGWVTSSGTDRSPDLGTSLFGAMSFRPQGPQFSAVSLVQRRNTVQEVSQDNDYIQVTPVEREIDEGSGKVDTAPVENFPVTEEQVLRTESERHQKRRLLLLMFVISAACLYNAVSVPWRLATGRESDAAGVVVELVLDLTVAGFLFVHKLGMPFEDHGKWIHSKKLIREHYFKSLAAVRDVVATFPIQLVCLPMGLSVAGMPVLRANKLLLVGYVPTAASLVGTTIEMRSPLYFRLLKFVSMSVCWLHIVTCLTIFCMRSESPEMGSQEPDPTLQWLKTEDLWRLSDQEQYTTVADWVLRQLCGHNGEYPLSDTQMSLSVFTSVTGLALLSVLLSLGTSAVQNHERTIGQLPAKLDAARDCMQHMRLPTTFQQEVRLFYRSMWQTCKTFSPEEQDSILNDLPEILAVRLRVELSATLVRRIPIFAPVAKNRTFLLEIVSALNFCMAVPGQVVVAAGDVGENLFFLIRGCLSILDDTGEQIDQIFDGSCFGEVSLLFGHVHEASAVAVSLSQMYVLGGEDFDRVVECFPEALEGILETATQHLARMTSSAAFEDIGNETVRPGKGHGITLAPLPHPRHTEFGSTTSSGASSTHTTWSHEYGLRKPRHPLQGNPLDKPPRSARSVGSAGDRGRGWSQAASLRGENAAASLRGENAAASLRGENAAASLRGENAATSLRGDSQGASIRGDSQAASLRGDFAASVRSHATSSRGDSVAAASLRGDNASPLLLRGDNAAASLRGDNAAAWFRGDNAAASTSLRGENVAAMLRGDLASPARGEASPLLRGDNASPLVRGVGIDAGSSLRGVSIDPSAVLRGDLGLPPTVRQPEPSQTHGELAPRSDHVLSRRESVGFAQFEDDNKKDGEVAGLNLQTVRAAYMEERALRCSRAGSMCFAQGRRVSFMPGASPKRNKKGPGRFSFMAPVVEVAEPKRIKKQVQSPSLKPSDQPYMAPITATDMVGASDLRVEWPEFKL